MNIATTHRRHRLNPKEGVVTFSSSKLPRGFVFIPWIVAEQFLKRVAREITHRSKTTLKEISKKSLHLITVMLKIAQTPNLIDRILALQRTVYRQYLCVQMKSGSPLTV